MRVAVAAVQVPIKAVIVGYFSFFFFHVSVHVSHILSIYLSFKSLALRKRTTQIWFQNTRARMKKKPRATTSSPPTYAVQTKDNLNLVDTLHLSMG